MFLPLYSLLEKGLLVAHLFSLLMAYLWCAIRIWYSNDAPLIFFLNLRSLCLNLGSICLISGQITLSGQTSRKVTHPSHYSSPSTLNFRVLSNPSNSSLHRHLLKYLAYQSYYTLLMSRTLFMFMTMMNFEKYFKLPGHITYHFWKKK